MHRRTLLAAVSCLLAGRAAAAETVHGAVVIARSGEHMPSMYAQTGGLVLLTSLGAQQSYAAGQAVRNRYTSGDTSIPNLSMDILEPAQVQAITKDDMYYQYYQASAMAFMQGLYPPYSFNASNELDGNDLLANGTVEESPLGGYQYPMIHTPSMRDPNVIYVDGSYTCTNFLVFSQQTYMTASYNQTLADTTDFYQSIGNALSDEQIGLDAYSYANAVDIWDYITYMVDHNPNFETAMTTGPLGQDDAYTRLRALASQQQWSVYGNTATDSDASNEQIGLIGGKTMAAFVYDQLQINIDLQGTSSVVTVMTTDYPAFLSWAAMSNLAEVDNAFEGIPDWASVMLFELFSFEGAQLIPGLNTNYPVTDDLYVRFLFQNGTAGNNGNDTDQTFTQYALFNNGADHMSWNDFSAAVAKTMVQQAYDWCSICATSSDFCSAYSNGGPESGPPSSSSDSNLSPKIAGLIGAVATLCVVGIFLLVVAACGGFRVSRASSFTHSESGLGGFKGGQKLASDPDLTMYKNGASASAEPVPKERVSSWEMKNGKAPAPRLSFEDDDRFDPFADPVRPAERL